MSPIARRSIAGTVVAAAVAAGSFLSATPALAWSSGSVSYPLSAAVQSAYYPYVVDSFSRSVNGSWGTGQRASWALSGDVAAAAVASGQATISLPSAGGNAFSVASAAATDTEVQARIGLKALPTAEVVDLYVAGRALDATSGYRTKLRVAPGGAVTVSIIRVDGTRAKAIATSTQTEKLTAGGQLQVRMQVVGTGTTQIRTKVWPAGQAEPAAWDAAVADTTAALQTGAGVAFGAYAPAGTGTSPVMTVSDVWAGPTTNARPVKRVIPTVGTYIPDATTTGVPAGTPLTVHQGDLTITTAGTVVENLDVRGFITVKAKNVTIRNTVVRGRTITSTRGLVTVEQTGSVTIEDSELYNATPNWHVDGLRIAGAATVRRVNVHDVIDTAHLWGTQPVVIEGSWLHDTLHYANDPSHSDGSHDDNVQIQQSTDVTLNGNRLEGAYNAAIQITQDRGPSSNIKITNNLIGGGTCSINVAEKGKGALQGLVIKNNKFTPDRRKAGCMVIAAVTTSSISTITGNTMTDGSTFAVKKG